MKRRLPLSLGLAISLWAHAMGNLSVNRYARIEVGARGAAIHYVLDLAETPTFELLRSWNLDAASPREQLQARAAQQARQWAAHLAVTVDGRSVAPRPANVDLVLDKGADGMPVARISMDLPLAISAGKLAYEDHNYEGRAGWKEIVIRAAGGAEIRQASHTDRERSQGLTAYPRDPAAAPPQDLRASVEWSAAPVAASPRPPKIVPLGTPQPATSVVRGDFLSQLLHRSDLGWGLILAGIAVAFGLGAIHALSPGHGKTLVAAYLVGTRGTPRHALFLGAMVTFTHTISVFALGLTTLFLSQYVLPEKIFPILGAISGISIVWIGGSLLYRRARRLRGHGRPHDHDHGPHGHSHAPEGEVTMASLIALGVSGGLVPCPSALVLLLSSVALGRVGLGLVLLVGFSAGLAVVLMAIGLTVLYAKHLLPDSQKTAAHPAFRLIPVISAALIVCIGMVMTCVSLGIIRPGGLLAGI